MIQQFTELFDYLLLRVSPKSHPASPAASHKPAAISASRARAGLAGALQHAAGSPPGTARGPCSEATRNTSV